MDRQLQRLLDLLDQAGEDTVNTSVRLPTYLREAAAVASGMGLVSSTTELAVRGMRDTLEAFAQRAVLDAHYQDNPGVRPTLAEVAIATAELDGNPLASRAALVRQAADAVCSLKADPNPDDVLIYAAALASAA